MHSHIIYFSNSHTQGFFIFVTFSREISFSWLNLPQCLLLFGVQLRLLLASHKITFARLNWMILFIPTILYAQIFQIRHVILLLCQFVNWLEILWLPVYVPSEEEKADPKLYASNVRKQMALEVKNGLY